MHDNVLAAHDHPAATKNIEQAELLPRPSTASAPDVWNQVAELMATADIDPRPDIEPEQGNAPVYVQTARPSDAYRAEQVFTEHDIDTIHSLGPGDCRVELYLAENGFDVTGYELNNDLVELIDTTFEIDSFELQQTDYHRVFDDLIGPNVGVLALGGNNKPPAIPDQGVLIEGYSELGVRAYSDGEPIYAW
jgi:hypothetical protein